METEIMSKTETSELFESSWGRLRQPAGGLRLVAIMAMFTLFMAVACDNPLQQYGVGPAQRGVTGISVGSVQSGGIGAQTVFPELQLADVDYYVISLVNGPSGAPEQTKVAAADVDGQITEAVDFVDLVPGTWDIEVAGYDAQGGSIPTDPESLSGAQVVSGSVADISVARGQFSTVSVSVVPLAEGEGDWELILQWDLDDPAEQGSDYEVLSRVNKAEYRIDDGGGWSGWSEVSAENLSLEGTLRQARAAGAHEFGDFMLQARLLVDDPGTPDTYEIAANYIERWYVYPNVLTSKTLLLGREEAFSFGGGVGITVDLSVPEDLESFFTGTPESTVPVGDTFIIIANVGGAESYAWQLDGEPVTGSGNGISVGGGGSTLTLAHASGNGPTKALNAGRVFAVTLEVTQGGIAYTGTHYVRVVLDE